MFSLSFAKAVRTVLCDIFPYDIGELRGCGQNTTLAGLWLWAAVRGDDGPLHGRTFLFTIGLGKPVKLMLMVAGAAAPFGKLKAFYAIYKHTHTHTHTNTFFFQMHTHSHGTNTRRVLIRCD